MNYDSETIKYYSALKRYELLNHEKTWRNVDIPYDSKYMMFCKGKTMEILKKKKIIGIPGLRREGRMNQHSTKDSSVQALSHVRLFATSWIAACQASLSITISQSSLKLISIESVIPSSHLILCCPLLLLPPIPPSIRVFSKESTLHVRWPKYWSFSFSIILFKEYPGLISFRMDWLDLLAVQGTLKSLLQHHSSKASHYYMHHLQV